MSDCTTILILKMTDLWIRHMQDICTENPDAEIVSELEEMVQLREQVLAIYTKTVEDQNMIDFVPTSISDFIEEHESEAMPVFVELFSEKPLQYLVRSNRPLSQSTADLLDEEFVDMIVLDQLPIR